MISVLTFCVVYSNFNNSTVLQRWSQFWNQSATFIVGNFCSICCAKLHLSGVLSSLGLGKIESLLMEMQCPFCFGKKSGYYRNPIPFSSNASCYSFASIKTDGLICVYTCFTGWQTKLTVSTCSQSCVYLCDQWHCIMSLAVSKTILFDTTQWIGIIVFVSYSRRARYNSFSLIVLLILGGGKLPNFLEGTEGVSVLLICIFF